MGLGFWAGATLLVAFLAFLVLLALVMRRSGQHAALEEREAWERASRVAVEEQAEDDRETLGRMADADAASVGDIAADARERMRARNPKTR